MNLSVLWRSPTLALAGVPETANDAKRGIKATISLQIVFNGVYVTCDEAQLTQPCPLPPSELRP